MTAFDPMRTNAITLPCTIPVSRTGIFSGVQAYRCAGSKDSVEISRVVFTFPKFDMSGEPKAGKRSHKLTRDGVRARRSRRSSFSRP